jgi:hypothetical protein
MPSVNLPSCDRCCRLPTPPIMWFKREMGARQQPPRNTWVGGRGNDGLSREDTLDGTVALVTGMWDVTALRGSPRQQQSETRSER